MVSDMEPRYRLVDANGNVVGSLYAESDGTLKLQEGTSGSDNEVSVATDGTFNAPSVSTEDLAAEDRDPDVVVKKDDSGTIKAIGNDEQREIASGSDFTTILKSAQEALTSGRSHKEKILIKGEFSLSSTFNADSFTIFELRGRVKLADSADTNMVKTPSTETREKIEFIGGTWDGNKANNPTGSSGKFIFSMENVADARFNNVTAKNASRDAFVPKGTWTDYQFIGCVAEGNNDDGFNPLDGTGATFTACIARNNGGHGFHPSVGSSQITVNNCIAYGNGVYNYHILSEHVTLDGAHGWNPGTENIFVNRDSNWIEINGGQFVGGDRGIQAPGLSDIKIKGLQISGVTIKDCSEWGIDIQNCPAFQVSNVRIENSGWDGINAEDNPGGGTITNPTIRDAGQNGIDVKGSSADVRIQDPDISGSTDADINDAATRTRINGVAQEALGGSAPATPSNWDDGDVVEDTDNAGDAYKKLPISGFSQIST